MRFMEGAVALATLVAVVGAAQAQEDRDAVFCYKVKQSKNFDKFGKTDATKKTYARIDDIIDVSNPQGLVPAEVPGVEFNYQVKKVKELCVPADVDAEGLSDASTHWMMYQIKQQKGECDGDPAVPCKKDDDCVEAGAGSLCTVYKETATPKFDKKDPTNTSVRVQDRYTDIRLDFAKEAMVMAPATEDGAAFQGVPSGEEHYKCYAVKPTKKACTEASPSNALGACKGEEDCGGTKKLTEFCQKLPKFPKETHQDGRLWSSSADSFQADQDPNEPEKTFDLKKIKMFCQSAESELVGAAASLVNEPQAGLLCYQAKLSGGKCTADAPENPLGSCKAEEQCGGEKKVTTYCQKKADPKFDKKDPDTLARFVEDEYFQHRIDVAKEDLLCLPACRGANDIVPFAFNDLVAHVTSLQFAPVDVGVNVDGQPTCQPAGCNPALGIDNALGLPFLTGIINPLLSEQIDTGSINLLFQLDQLVDGNVTISGFLGNLDLPTGCANGDPNNPPVDPGNPADPCNYLADSGSFTDPLRTNCTEEEALISLDVALSGAGTAPTATAQGGGPGNDFTLNIPLGGQSFQITAQNVLVDATVTHDTSDVSEITGVLGGGVNHQALIDAVSSIPGECSGGSNDGGTCTNDAQCPGGACYLSESITFSPEALAQTIGLLIPPDLDLDPNDSPGTNGGCPACESVSLNLAFEATEALVTGTE